MAATGRDEGSSGVATSALTTADSATTDRIALEITSAKLSVSGQRIRRRTKPTSFPRISWRESMITATPFGT